MDTGQTAATESASLNGARPPTRRIAPVALRPDEVGPGNLEEQQRGNGKEPVDSGRARDQEGEREEADRLSSRSDRDESSDMDEDQMSGPSNAEPQGPLSEEQLQDLVDQLIAVELQNYEMQEELEEESLKQLRDNVAAELAEQHQGDALEEAIESELALFREYKEEDLNEGQAKAAELQELLEDAGVFLRGVYMEIDRMWSEQAKTETWKNAQWTKDKVPERVKAVLKEAGQELEAQRPVGTDKEGRRLGLGASGFMARKVQEIRKKSRQIEKRRAKAAAKIAKQPLNGASEATAGPQEEDESSSEDDEAVSEPEESISGEAIWAAVCSSDDEGDTFAKIATNPTAKTMFRQFASRYKAETPEDAVRLCETIEGATEVEEIGESGVAESKVVEGLLKKAYKEESKKGLTETQRKTMKKRGDDEDRVKTVRQRKKHQFKEPKPRKPRAPRAPTPKSAASKKSTEPLGPDAREASTPLVAQSGTEAAPEARSTAAAKPLKAGTTSPERSFETAQEDGTESISAVRAGAEKPEKARPLSPGRDQPVEQADFPACEADDSPVGRGEGWAEADGKTESVGGGAVADQPSEGARGTQRTGAMSEAEIPSPSDDARQENRGGSGASPETEQAGVKRASLGESPAVKRPRFALPTGVQVVDLASESEEEAATPAPPVVVELEDTEPMEGSVKEEKSSAKKASGSEEFGEGSEPPIARRTRGQLRAALGEPEPVGKLAEDADMEAEEEDTKVDDRTVEEVARDAARKREQAAGKRKAEEGPTSSKEGETLDRSAEAVGESPVSGAQGPKFGATAASCAASATVAARGKEDAEVSSPVRTPRRCPDSPASKKKLKRLSELETPSVWKGRTPDSEEGTEERLAESTPANLEGTAAKSEQPESARKLQSPPLGGRKRGRRRLVLQDDEEEVHTGPSGRRENEEQERAGSDNVEKSSDMEADGRASEKPEATEPVLGEEARGTAGTEGPSTPETEGGAQEVTPKKAEGHVTPKKDGTVEDDYSDEEMEDAADSDDAWDRKKDREMAKREAAQNGSKKKKPKKRKSADVSKGRLGKKGDQDSDGFYSAEASPSKRRKSDPSSKDEEEEQDGAEADGTEVSGKSSRGKKGKEKGTKKKGKKVRLGCKCTTCPKALKQSKVRQHPVLLVTQCRRCLEHYKAATFPVGDDGWEEECQWCGDGGTLTLCTSCKKTVCRDCVVRNLGDAAWETIGDNWVCYSCDNEPIRKLQEAHCRAAETEGGEEGGTGTSAAQLEKKKRKGRRNIKAINDQLDPETQAKLNMERERLARIEQRRANTALSPLKGPRGTPRKSVGAAVDEDSPEMVDEEVGFDKELGDGNSGRTVIINTSRPEDEDPIFIDPAIAEKLKPHQVEGVRFMWENIVETVKICADTPKEGLGCILAHSMGLGKTLQVVTLVHTLLTNRELNVRTVLIVVPVNVLRNWSSEFNKWQGGQEHTVRKKVKVYTVEDAGSKNEQRAEMLARWQRTGGAMIIGYTAFRNAVSGRTIKDPALRESFKQSLRDPGPDVLICDEAHMIKNIKADITKELKAVKTRRRVALTGSPLQNNLLEYYCMVDFVRERLLGTVAQFKNKFQNPISNGQHIDSTKTDIRKMKRQSHVLHKLLLGFVQRKDQRLLGDMLPPKSVYVLSVRLSPLQRRLYQRLLAAIPHKQGKSGKNYLFQAYQALTKVWNHPNLLHMAKEKEDAKAEDTLEDAIAGDDESGEPPAEDPSASVRPKTPSAMPSVSGATATAQPGRGEDDAVEEGAVNSPAKGDRNGAPGEQNGPRGVSPSAATEASGERNGSGTGTGAELERNGSESGKPPARRGRGRPPGAKTKTPRQPGLDIPNSWWQEEMPDPVDLIDGSGKVAIVLDLLRTATARGDKMLVFSQSLFTLDVMEAALATLPRVESGTGETWCKNREYYRLDGSTPSTARQKLVERFNDPSNTDVKCVLISTKAGSLGINLPAANRVVIFDGSWNPTHDLQAMFRAWRFGQTKPVFVYRLLACGTMEENIYARQVTKESLSARVVDEQQVANHFSNQELESLYTLAEDDDDYVPEESTAPANAPSPATTTPANGVGRSPDLAADVIGAAAGAAAAAEGAAHPERVEEAVKEAVRRGVKEFAIPDDAPPKDDVLARVLLRNRPRWIVRYHEHDVLLEDKEQEHLDEREKALAWKEHEEAAIREAQPELTQHQVAIQLLLKDLHQVEQNAELGEDEKRLQLRSIHSSIGLQRNLQAQLELNQRHQAELLQAAALAQAQAQAAQGHVASGAQGHVATGPQGHVPAAPAPGLRGAPVREDGEGKAQKDFRAAAAAGPSQPLGKAGLGVDREGGQKESRPAAGGDEKVRAPVKVQSAVERLRAKEEHARRAALYARMGL